MKRVNKPYRGDGNGRQGKRKPAFMLVQFIVCLLFWLLLSGHYDVKHITMGVISSLIVTLVTNDLFYTLFFMRGMGDKHDEGSIVYVFKTLLKIVAYAFWLLYQIIMANLRVAYLVLHPRMPIDPKIMAFKSDFKKSISLVTLANSITLTPGTITVDLHEGKFLVHAIDKESAGSLIDASMQNRIAAVFGEPHTDTLKIEWYEKVAGLK